LQKHGLAARATLAAAPSMGRLPMPLQTKPIAVFRFKLPEPRLAAGNPNVQYPNPKKIPTPKTNPAHPVILSKTFFFVPFVSFCAKKS